MSRTSLQTSTRLAKNCQLKSHWEADGPASTYPRILRDNLQVFRQRHWFYNAEDWQ